MANRFDIKIPQFVSEETPLIKSALELRKGTREFAKPIVEKGLEFAKKVGEIAIAPGTELLTPKLEEAGIPALPAALIGLGIDVLTPGPGEFKKLNQVADTALSRLVRAVKEAKPARKELEKLASAERARRAGAAAGVLEKAKGETAFFKAKGQLKGELVPEKPKFKAIRPELGQGDIDTLFTQIQRNPDLDVYEKISAADGFSQLLKGEIPQPSKLSLLEDIFGKELIQETLNKRPALDKLKDLATEIINVPRSLMASFDMSAPLRQGILFTLTKPKSAIKAGQEMFRQAFSEKNYIQWLDDVKKDSFYKTMKEADLYIADSRRVSGGLAAREERFMSNLADRIPIVGRLTKASERAYTSYLNKLRVDVFTNTAAKFQKMGLTPKDNPELYQSLAGFVNNATGRGDLGKFNRVSQQLNTLFFSPRLIASRFNLLNPAWYLKQSPPVRKEAIKSFAEFVGVGIGILSLAKLGGADVEIDPRSTDFGKIKIGNTRWDIWGGFQQWIRVFSQLATGERKTQQGKVIPLSKKKFPFETRLDVAERFLRGKLAPIPSLALEVFEGQKLYGEELKPLTEIQENITPLYLQDIGEAFEQLGPSALISVGVPAFFGVGVQTFEEKAKGNRFNF